jgi:uncharacterized membrane protein
MTNIYQSPEADLSENSHPSTLGSIENGKIGQYRLDVGEVISEAWSLTKGCKLTFNVALGIYTVIIIVGMILAFAPLINAVSDESVPQDSLGTSIFQVYAIYFAVILLVMPMMAGLFMMGLKRATDQDVSIGIMFSYYRKLIPILLLMIVSGILIEVGFLLLLIPGIYLCIAYSLSMLLIADKNLSFWSAMETSRKAITHKWFTVFGVMVLLWVINVIGMIPLGIGLIWTLPMTFVAFGIMYRNIFGVESPSA